MTVDLEQAEQFLAAHGRILERRRFAQRFRGGAAAPVRDAVAAYRNDDGGFGHALEPDGRGPESQPAATMTALVVLDEADAWDDALARSACDWLARSGAPDGVGTPFVVPGVERWPHGPWWMPTPGLPPSLVSSGMAMAPLLARGVEHPWIERTAAWLWSMAADAGDPDPYELRGLLRFLDRAPDRDRAQAAARALGPAVERALQSRPGAPPDEHHPLDLAPHPDSVARPLFGADAIAADLDRLEAGQQDDGGWTFTWLAWSPLAEHEWRGVVTVEALAVLEVNGRL